MEKKRVSLQYKSRQCVSMASFQLGGLKSKSTFVVVKGKDFILTGTQSQLNPFYFYLHPVTGWYQPAIENCSFPSHE